MKLRKVNKRPGRALPVSFVPNRGGLGGSDQLIIRVGPQYLVLEFETREEIRELMSQAAIINHNWRK